MNDTFWQFWSKFHKIDTPEDTEFLFDKNT